MTKKNKKISFCDILSCFSLSNAEKALPGGGFLSDFRMTVELLEPVRRHPRVFLEETREVEFVGESQLEGDFAHPVVAAKKQIAGPVEHRLGQELLGGDAGGGGELPGEGFPAGFPQGGELLHRGGGGAVVLDVVQFRLELREAGDELQFRPAAVAEQEGDELLGDAAEARSGPRRGSECRTPSPPARAIPDLRFRAPRGPGKRDPLPRRPRW